MLLIDLKAPQIIIICILAIAALLLVIFYAFLPLRKLILKKNFNVHCYKKIYKIVMANDFYLLNNLKFKDSDNNLYIIDHLVFSDKYVYLFIDRYFDVDVFGRIFDKSLVKEDKIDKYAYLDNPIEELKKVVESFSLETNIDKSLIIGVVIYNSNIESLIEGESNHYFISKRNSINNIFDSVEARDVKKIDAEKLENTVINLYKKYKVK